MKLKVYRHKIFIFLFIVQILNCFCTPIQYRNGSTNQQSLTKRSPMRPAQSEDRNHPRNTHPQHGTTSSGLRPGRQEYRVFRSESTQSHSQSPTPSHQRQRPTPIQTERHNRFSSGGHHFGGGRRRPHSPSVGNSPSALAHVIGDGIEGVAMSSMGMESHLGVMPNAGRHGRRTEVGVVYTAPTLPRSSSSSSSSGGVATCCLDCICDAISKAFE